jgi:hypothetical protein
MNTIKCFQILYFLAYLFSVFSFYHIFSPDDPLSVTHVRAHSDNMYTVNYTNAEAGTQ